MRTVPFTALIAWLTLAPSGALADVTLPMSSRELFLRVDPTDLAEPPRIVRLADYGLAPGQSIGITAMGDFDNGPGEDIYSTMVAVFSAGDSLRPDTVQDRVPGALDCGRQAVTGVTCPSGLPTDILHDFYVGTAGVQVTIPAGATHLFIMTSDCFFVDNTDPDGDYAVRITTPEATSVIGAGDAPGLHFAAPWPNPSAATTRLTFHMPESGRVSLSLHGADGRRVRTLAEGELAGGAHTRFWDGLDEGGSPVPPGIYFARLEVAGAGKRQAKIVITR